MLIPWCGGIVTGLVTTCLPVTRPQTLTDCFSPLKVFFSRHTSLLKLRGRGQGQGRRAILYSDEESIILLYSSAAGSGDMLGFSLLLRMMRTE